jgi:diaminopimelate epimerase
MCGNGMRAIGVFLGARISGRKNFLLDTASGPVKVDLHGTFPEVALGTPKVLYRDEKISLPGGISGEFARVDMGNPHAVFFLGHGFPENNTAFGKIGSITLDRVGRSIENHTLFPNRTNVEFVEIELRTKLRVRVWERGTGATLACGSGACAVVAAAESLGLTEAGAKVEVVLPGGSVFVRLEPEWASGRGSALLSGPAEEVFSGEWHG